MYFASPCEQEQAVVPVVHADRRAGLVVGGHVRQLVRLAERLAAAGRADAAGEVELACDEVVPDRDRLRLASSRRLSSAATSAMPEYMYIARTAWPTGSV